MHSIFIMGGLAFLAYGMLRAIPEALHFYGSRHFPDIGPTADAPLWSSGIGTMLAGLAFYLANADPTLFPWWCLILLSLYGACRVDARFQIIPDRFHLFGAIGVAGWMIVASQGAYLPHLLGTAIISLALPASLWLLNALYRRWRGHDGLGFGDIKLLVWLAPLLGQDIYLGLFLACALALLANLPLWRRRSRFATFAFGPYLAAGSVGVILLTTL